MRNVIHTSGASAPSDLPDFFVMKCSITGGRTSVSTAQQKPPTKLVTTPKLGMDAEITAANTTKAVRMASAGTVPSSLPALAASGSVCTSVRFSRMRNADRATTGKVLSRLAHRRSFTIVAIELPSSAATTTLGTLGPNAMAAYAPKSMLTTPQSTNPTTAALKNFFGSAIPPRTVGRLKCVKKRKATGPKNFENALRLNIGSALIDVGVMSPLAYHVTNDMPRTTVKFPNALMMDTPPSCLSHDSAHMNGIMP
mmetsp:Transcript_7316/g.16667  ORF Transcript_7316/g.16667 Transcript_7316/m.16667 type:complete len:254 (+) Transcript_7316:932-1693(+)